MKKKEKKKSFEIKNELSTELFPTQTIELLDRRISFQIESFPIVSNGDPSLLWMPISMLRPDWRTSTIAAMRRMSAWWSFSACDRRLTLMISQLGSTWVGVWVVGVWVTSESGQWVWAFCSKEEHKEEQIKKKRERKKSREERGKKKERKERVTSGMWQCLTFGAHNLSNITNLPLSNGIWVLKTAEMSFHFPSLSLIFLSHRIMKTESWNMSHGIQTTALPWILPVLDHELWKQDDITLFREFPNKL